MRRSARHELRERANSAPAQGERISNRILADLIAVNGVPGMGASVWRSGRIVWTGSAGYRDVARKLPVTRDTRFRLASVSKIVTATAAGKLSEAVKLDLDAPVAKIVPGLRPDWSGITVRQLAAHSSGLPHYQAVDLALGKRAYPTVAQQLDLFRDRPLLQPPGQKYEYSSWGFVLISAAIERAAGRPFLDYLASDITPGLAIFADRTGTGDPDMSIAYGFENSMARPEPPRDMSYTWAGGGLAATPAALASFGGRLLDGRIVRPATFEAMQVPVKLNDGSIAGEDGFAMGLGWRLIRDPDGARTVYHSGVVNGARSTLILWPETGMAVSLLSNAIWVSSIEASAMTIAAPFRAPPPSLTARACPVTAKRFAGKFNDADVSGAASFRVIDGICTGMLEAGGNFATYFNPFEQKDAGELRITGIDAAGGLSRAALAAPTGIFDLRAQADGSLTARFSATRTLTITLM